MQFKRFPFLRLVDHEHVLMDADFISRLSSTLRLLDEGNRRSPTSLLSYIPGEGRAILAH